MKQVTIGILIVLLITAPLAAQDYFLKQKSHTDAYTMMGQSEPASDEVQTTWFSGDLYAQIGQKESMIYDLKKKEVTAINHKTKEYTIIKLGSAAAGEGQAMMQGMMGSAEVTVEATSEVKTINKWKCKKYVQTMSVMGMTFTTTLWASKDVKLNVAAYKKMIAGQYALMPGMKSKMEELQKEMEKIEGIVVRTETHMNVMGSEMNSWSELIEYGQKAAPKNVFAIPAGYTEKVSQMPF